LDTNGHASQTTPFTRPEKTTAAVRHTGKNDTVHPFEHALNLTEQKWILMLNNNRTTWILILNSQQQQ
jgi:hypothetical protein